MRCPECGKEKCEHVLRRADGRVEWLCKHGVGHTIFAPERMGKAGYVHGCDGCCSNVRPVVVVE